MGGLRKIIPPVAGIGSLFGQAIGGDVSYAQGTGYWGGLSVMNKLKLVAGDFVSRITNGHAHRSPMWRDRYSPSGTSGTW